jgi:hypothetical protein
MGKLNALESKRKTKKLDIEQQRIIEKNWKLLTF